MKLEKFSFGVGDRFAHQGQAQLQAFIKARKAGVDIAPVWNKSHREHRIIHSAPSDVLLEADRAVKACGWNGPYYVDADHINLENVEFFLDYCNFFTLDVADYIGQPCEDNEIDAFIERHRGMIGSLIVPGVEQPFDITENAIRKIARHYLHAVRQAAHLYQRIARRIGAGAFVTEVSMDETETSQTPMELLFILAALSDEQVPVQTIAPKFTGRFIKGVDYVGDPDQFRVEFEQDVCVIRYAISVFNLPENLKLSIHSGSDKFSLYSIIRETIHAHSVGVHVKTAGTTWLEEVIGLAAAEGEGLAVAREIYATAFERCRECCEPYAAVIDIDESALPLPDEVNQWPGKALAAALTHDPNSGAFNPNLRQLLHVGYKIAAEMGQRFTDALEQNQDVIAQHVTHNIFERHIKPLFLEDTDK